MMGGGGYVVEQGLASLLLTNGGKFGLKFLGGLYSVMMYNCGDF